MYPSSAILNFASAYFSQTFLQMLTEKKGGKKNLTTELQIAAEFGSCPPTGWWLWDLHLKHWQSFIDWTLRQQLLNTVIHSIRVHLVCLTVQHNGKPCWKGSVCMDTNELAPDRTTCSFRRLSGPLWWMQAKVFLWSSSPNGSKPLKRPRIECLNSTALTVSFSRLFREKKTGSVEGLWWKNLREPPGPYSVKLQNVGELETSLHANELGVTLCLTKGADIAAGVWTASSFRSATNRTLFIADIFLYVHVSLDGQRKGKKEHMRWHLQSIKLIGHTMKRSKYMHYGSLC